MMAESVALVVVPVRMAKPAVRVRVAVELGREQQPISLVRVALADMVVAVVAQVVEALPVDLPGREGTAVVAVVVAAMLVPLMGVMEVVLTEEMAGIVRRGRHMVAVVVVVAV